MICGFVQNGRGFEAVGLFDQMVKEGFKFDYISFVGVIFVCSYVGLVDKGWEYFILMEEDYEIKFGIEYCNCMVDFLGRVGLIEEVENLIEKVEIKGFVFLWLVFFGVCIISRNLVVVECIVQKMMELEFRNYLSYVYFINVYKFDGCWNDVMMIRKLMEERGVEKLLGRSLVEKGFFL